MSGPGTNVVIPIEDYGRMTEELTRLSGENEALKKYIEQRNEIGLQRAKELLHATQAAKDLRHDLEITDKRLLEAQEIIAQLQEQLAEANEDNVILYNAVQNMLRGA